MNKPQTEYEKTERPVLTIGEDGEGKGCGHCKHGGGWCATCFDCQPPEVKAELRRLAGAK